MADLRSDVIEALRNQAAPAGSLPLWEEITEAYENGGPDAVEALLEKKVKAIRSSANAQGREMKEAVGAVSKKSRSKKRR